MLEDIAAPGCFEIQRMLNEEEGIFTIHDDQWGTAIVFILAVIIALNIAKKEPKKCKVVICGAGAAGVAVAKLLNTMGIGEIIAFDSKGPIHEGRDYLPPAKMELAKMNVNGFAGTMKEALEGADGFIGLSEPNLFFGQEIELLQEMANNAFVFAGANPDPEFDLEAIAKYREEGGPLENIAFFGGGGFGKPGATLNNSSAFPGLYKALTDAIAEGKFLAKGKIDLAELALACAKALVPLLTKEDLARGSVVPRTFTNDGYNFKLTQAVATAAWQVFTGESPEAARERYKNLPDELRKEQQDTIDKLEGLPPDLKMFMQGLIELIGVTNDAMKEMRKKVSIDPDVPQTPSPAPNPAPRGPIPAEYLHLIGQAA